MTLSPGVKTQWSRFESRDGARISHPASKSLDRLSLVIGHSVGVEVLQPHIGSPIPVHSPSGRSEARSGANSCTSPLLWKGGSSQLPGGNEWRIPFWSRRRRAAARTRSGTRGNGPGPYPERVSSPHCSAIFCATFGDFCGISGNHIGRDRTGRARMYLDVVVRVVGGDGFEPPNPAL